MARTLLAASCLAVSALAGLLPLDLDSILPLDLSDLVLFSHISEPPQGWTSLGAPEEDLDMLVQIGLTQTNIAGLQDKLTDISNPSSPNYGQWLGQDEIDQFAAPSSESVKLVKDWLAQSGITDEHINQPTSDWIEFHAPISKVQTLLNSSYELYEHSHGGVIPRTKAYSLPQHLHPHIDMIAPTTAFYRSLEIKQGVPSGQAAPPSKRQSCDPASLTPACLKSLYNVDYTPALGQQIAVAGFLGTGASQSDFQQFHSQHGLTGQNSFIDTSVSGGVNPAKGDITEGNLDTQWAAGVADPNPVQYLAIGPGGSTLQNFTDEISNLASYLTSDPNPPMVVASSYLGEESIFDTAYMNRICNEFMKAGSRGISVIFCTGDFGVGGYGQQTCPSTFFPNFPASCPWVTAVGGTSFEDGKEVVGTLISPKYSSGGGFSNVFATPDYQKEQVMQYRRTLGVENVSKYNGSGRAYPDVSLVSTNFRTVVNGKTENLFGTSASAPAFAAMVNLLNDYRQSNSDKGPLGFLNPLLYSSHLSSVYNDITQGSNPGCDSEGFRATTGWDAATGLGSVDFSKLRSLIL